MTKFLFELILVLLRNKYNLFRGKFFFSYGRYTHDCSESFIIINSTILLILKNKEKLLYKQ
jgi:hypothetical protein